MTEVDEEAVVHVRARVIEEVMIGKEVAEKIETIHQTLRHTDAEVEEVPGVRRFDDHASDFRTYYTQRLAKSGLGYEKHSPAFRFGYSLTYAGCGRRRTPAPGSSAKTPSVSPGRGCAAHANHGARVWLGRDGSIAVSSCPVVSWVG